MLPACDGAHSAEHPANCSLKTFDVGRPLLARLHRRPARREYPNPRLISALPTNSCKPSPHQSFRPTLAYSECCKGGTPASFHSHHETAGMER